MFWESEIYYNNLIVDDVKIKTHRKCSTLTNKQKYIITFNNQILYGFFYFLVELYCYAVHWKHFQNQNKVNFKFKYTLYYIEYLYKIIIICEYPKFYKGKKLMLCLFKVQIYS